MTLAQTERTALADLFGTLGPDQPTLCEGWDTKDLLIHLIVREHRFDAVASRMIPPLNGWNEKVEAGFAKRPWNDLIEEYRSGPPAWNPMGWGKLDELTNGGEMFIHHEDARRGQADWKPRTFDPATETALEKIVGSGVSKLALRKSPVGVVAALPSSKMITLKAGEPVVTITGEAGEILLWLSGRTASIVELSGDEKAVSQLVAMKRGL